ncbi:MAG: hypothetical protein WKF73_03665 [Nocardioidaceae bacterium]
MPVWLLRRFTPNTRKALVTYQPRRASPTSLGRTTRCGPPAVVLLAHVSARLVHDDVRRPLGVG